MAIETIKFSQMTDGGDLAPGDFTPGLLNNANVLFSNPWTFLPPGTTGDRPAPSAEIYYRLRINTTLQVYEYYDPIAAAWVQISESDGVTTAQGTEHQVLVNGTFGIPTENAIILTLPQDIDTDSDVEFSTLKLGANTILASNDGIVIQFGTFGLPASPVNYFNFQNSGTGISPRIQTVGADTNVGFDLFTIGTGVFGLWSEATTNQFTFNTGTSFVHSSIFNFPATSVSRTYTWPDASGTVALTSGASGIVNPGLINQIAYYAAAGTTLSGLTNANQAVLTTDGSGLPALVPMIAGQILIGTTSGAPVAAAINSGTNITVANGSGSITVNLSGVIAPTLGGTGINNGSNTLTLAGNLATSGAFASTFTMTGATNVTFPTSGTLATTSQLVTPAALTKTDDTNVTLTLGGSPSTALVNAASLTLGWTGLLSIARGGTGVGSVTTSPTATSFAGWDANRNLSTNALINGFNTTVSSGGNTVLTVASAEIQEITGTLTQTITLPVASTVVAGQPYFLINNSSAAVTVNSSGGNLILTMAANTTASILCVLNSGTTAASWNASYIFDNGAGVLSITGTANQVIASASTGAVTLSLPQDIAISSAVQFASARLSNTGILDSNNNPILTLSATGSAVNYLTAFNNVTGNYPSLKAAGSDTNVDLGIWTQAAGVFHFNTTATSNQYQFTTGAAYANNAVMNFANTGTKTYTWPNASGTVLLSNVGITTVNVQVISTTGTYTPTAGMVYCVIEVVGGGGGGGGSGTTVAAQIALGAGGGGGGYARTVATLAQIQGGGSVAAVTIGAGGTAGNTSGSAGGNGGATSVVANNGAGSTLAAANGGSGGNGGGTGGLTTSQTGPAGGVGTTGTLLINGGSGGASFGTANSGLAGFGGSSFFGGGANAVAVAGNVNNGGIAGSAFGGGGSGGGNAGGVGTAAGGAGFKGAVVITEYIAA